MESPAGWDLLTASLAACDLGDPSRAWAFLVLRGLVIDDGDHRTQFVRVVERERGREITGPSPAQRIAGHLRAAGATTPGAAQPDGQAGVARARWQVVRALGVRLAVSSTGSQ